MNEEKMIKLSEYEVLKNKYNALIEKQDDIVRMITFDDYHVINRMSYDFQAYETLKNKYNKLVDKCNSIIEAFEIETGCFNGECGAKEEKIY